MGSKSNVSIFNQSGPICMKKFKHIFAKLYVLQYKSEFSELLLFIESNIESLEKTEPAKSISLITQDFFACSDIDHDSDKVCWIKNQLSHLNVSENGLRYNTSELLT